MLRKWMLALALLLCACACAQGAYDEIRDLGSGYTAVGSGGKWGVISAEGVTILPIENDIVYLGPEGELIYYRDDEVWSLQLEGDFAEPAAAQLVVEPARTVEPAPTRLSPDPDAPYHMLSGNRGDYVIAHKIIDKESLVNGYTAGEGYQGIANRDGEIILPCRFDGIEFNDTNDGGRLYCSNGEDSSYMYFRLDGNEISFYAKDADGSEIPLPDWSGNWGEVIPLDSQPVTYLAALPADSERSGWALLDAQGKPKNHRYLETLRDFSMDIAAVRQNGLWGYLRRDGSWLLKPQFSHAYPFDETRRTATITTGSKWGVIDSSGAYTIQPQYDQLYTIGYVGDCYYKVGMVNPGMEDISYSIHDDVYSWGIIDAAGKTILPIAYDGFDGESEDGTIIAERDGKKTLYQLTKDGVVEVQEYAPKIRVEDYMPMEGKKVAKLREEPTLARRASADHGHPRINAPQELFPLAAAIVEAVYPAKSLNGETFSLREGQNVCYYLNEKTVDIAFCIGSPEEMVRYNGEMEDYRFIPVAREALVFYALEDLRAELTADELRSIYSGKTTAWTAFSTPCEIIPYQPLYDSAAQDAMQVFMDEAQLMPAPQISRDVGGWEPVVENAPFRTVEGGVGYTLKKIWDDNPMKGLTALPIDGKLPGEEGYPATAEVYMAVRADEDNPNVQALIDWALSEQGQKLVEKAGYMEK